MQLQHAGHTFYVIHDPTCLSACCVRVRVRVALPCLHADGWAIIPIDAYHRELALVRRRIQQEQIGELLAFLIHQFQMQWRPNQASNKRNAHGKACCPSNCQLCLLWKSTLVYAGSAQDHYSHTILMVLFSVHAQEAYGVAYIKTAEGNSVVYLGVNVYSTTTTRRKYTSRCMIERRIYPHHVVRYPEFSIVAPQQQLEGRGVIIGRLVHSNRRAAT